MEKNGELKAGQSLCDYCSSPARFVAGDTAWCRDHAGKAAAKIAGAHAMPLKSASPELKDRFDEVNPNG